MDAASRSVPRVVALEPYFSSLLPEVLIGVTAEQFAGIAAQAMTAKEEPHVNLGHLHVPKVSVREQAAVIVNKLRSSKVSTFRALIADADSIVVVVGRFLALLELFREHAVLFEQVAPLGDLTIRWTGGERGEFDITEEFDSSPEGSARDGDPWGVS